MHNTHLRNLKKDLLASEAGSIMPIFAISLIAIVALVGATLALSMDSRAANDLQFTADNAAIAGATAFIHTNSAKLQDRIHEAEETARVYAERNAGYGLKSFDVLSKSEDVYGQNIRLGVSLEFKATNAAAGLTGRNANVQIERSAKAEAVWGFPLCTLSLAGQNTGLLISGEANLTAENCLVWTNTSGRESMTFAGGRLTSKYACAHGTYRKTGAARVMPLPSTNCRQIPDPLARWQAPVPGKPIVEEELDLPYVRPEEREDKYDGNKQDYLNQVRQFMKDNGRRSEFPQFAYELQRIGAEGAQPTKANASLLALDASITLDLDQLDDVTGPAHDNDWSHPQLNIDQHSQTQLNPSDGTVKNGVGAGLTLLELAEAAGLYQPSSDDLPPIDEDRYFELPTLKIDPGTYIGLHIFEGHVQMRPGIYHIVDAPLILRRRATLTGEGVTIILHGDDATFEVLDEARLSITAPVNGATAGFAIAQNKAKVKSIDLRSSRLAGSGKASLIGTVYLPKQNFEITGSGSGDQASPLLQIVANEIRLKQKGALKIDFDETETNVPVVIKPERTARLIE